MARILMTTHAITGHVRYATPIVRELVAQGHEVLWYTGLLFEPVVTGTGASFAPITERTGLDFSKVDALQAAPGRDGGLGGFRKTLLDVFVAPIPAFMADIAELLESFKPDVLVADHSFMAGIFLAEQRGLPRVAFSTGALNVPSVDTAPHGTGLPPARGPLGRLRNRLLYQAVRQLVMRQSQAIAAKIRTDLGLKPMSGLFISWPPQMVHRYIQSSVPEFEYPRRDLPASVVFIGATRLDGLDKWAVPDWWARVEQSRAAGRPIVFVTQGSAATDPENLLLPTAEALAGEDVLVVATGGGRDPQEVLPLDRRPANVILEPYIPFTEILPAVDLMVTNGGFGGIQTALEHGVPLVAVGDSEDHMENNTRVAWSGAGVALKKERQTAAAMGTAVRTVLDQPSYRARARELMAAYQRYPDAAAEAAHLILEVAGAVPTIPRR